MSSQSPPLGMILKGYPRISESFISSEILLLESLGIAIRIYSLRQPREPFTHENVKRIQAPVTYMPEYVLPHWRTLLRTNAALVGRIGLGYVKPLGGAVRRAIARRKAATLRHFLQAGHLAALRLTGPNADGIRHLHAHFCHTPTSVALFASQLTRLPFSFTAHAKDIYTSEPDQLRRKISLARFAVTCTRYNARYLSELSDGRTPVHTVYHGIDTDYFSFGHHPPPASPYKILSIGRLVAKKGYDDLLQALHILDRAGLEFQFVHIGSGEQKEEIKALTARLGLTHRVSMLGTLPHEEVIHHYRSSHCFALACKIAPNGDRDGIPNVLVEAMAVGLPVVSTRLSGIPELVEDGVTGTLVKPEDPAAMASAIQAVLADPPELRDRKLRARAKVEEEFDNKRCVVRLHRVLREALADGKERRPAR